MRVTFYDSSYGMLGVQYNMATLLQAGHEVDLFLDNSMTKDHLTQDLMFRSLFSLSAAQVVEGLMATDPQVVCFSLPTYLYRPCLAIMEELKRQHPEMIVCVGGVHPTLLPEVTIRNECIDFAVVGEGEYAFPKLITDIEERGVDAVKASPPEAHPGCWSRYNGEIIKRGFSPTVKDLDAIPFPEKRWHFKQNPALQPIYATMASRGCVFTCTFCNSASLNVAFREEGNAKFYRCRSVDNVLEELKLAKERYGMKYVQFFDDIFGVKRSWLQEFSEKYPDAIGLPFEIQTNPKIHNHESMDMLAKAGCAHLEFGFQSANAEIRREMLSRKETNIQVADLIHHVRKRGMLMELDLIMNLPGETEAEIREAIEFVQDVRPELVNTSFLQYFPRIPITQTALKQGVLQESDLKRIEDGEMIYSPKLLKQEGLKHRYRILPFQMFLAAHFPRWISNPGIAIVGLPGLRRIVSYFGSLLVYMTRVWIGWTDKRDFYHRRQVHRGLVSAKTIFLHKFGGRKRNGRRMRPAPADLGPKI